ncbi:hypothetical protein FRC14_001920 [Serendipita sp. 396]|nr:hypothetical protein FRC14_001920 [Serendipita sp. 396]KAG8785260.1 hypothetical protein FRC15_001702 [Serendipita sp. 397]KAG8800988.1 hypothetical protein FRC16_001533 [Serendipita sp. 398]KAG8837177.1 hypothetical protein FRC18_009901 [Serendipita sp. 400]KAG8852899.1 hypothetical protein FRB91_005731 [Serendipita sp. 411]KAG8869413.1 hypothetical protein FRC20_001503 [Serendipita sp. 405]
MSTLLASQYLIRRPPYVLTRLNLSSFPPARTFEITTPTQNGTSSSFSSSSNPRASSLSSSSMTSPSPTGSVNTMSGTMLTLSTISLTGIPLQGTSYPSDIDVSEVSSFPDPPSTQNISPSMIVGVVIGALTFLAMVIFIIFLLKRKQRIWRYSIRNSAFDDAGRGEDMRLGQIASSYLEQVRASRPPTEACLPPPAYSTVDSAARGSIEPRERSEAEAGHLDMVATVETISSSTVQRENVGVGGKERL